MTMNFTPHLVPMNRGILVTAYGNLTKQYTYDEIKDNDYDLSINKYKEVEYVPIEYPSTAEIMSYLSELEMKIGEEMDALVAAMNGKPGDLLLFAADKNKIVWNVLGALRLELAKELDVNPTEVIKKLMNLGIMASLNNSLSFEQLILFLHL